MTTEKTISTGINANKTIPATILAITGLSLSVTLYTTLSLSELTLVAFVGMSALSSFLVFFGPRLRKADIAKLQFEIDKIEQTEASVKEVAASIIDVIETREFALMDESYHAEAADTALAKLKALVSYPERKN